MTPQSNFMVAAPIAPGQETGLRALLATMNLSPGVVDPNNALVPFARFDRLHVARFVILQDETLGDLSQYDATLVNLPVWLVFLGDCDGPAETMLAEFVAQAGARTGEDLRTLRGIPPPGRSACLDAGKFRQSSSAIRELGRAHCAADSRGGSVARDVARPTAEWFQRNPRLKSTDDWLLPCGSLAPFSLHRRRHHSPGWRTGSATSSACRSR